MIDWRNIVVVDTETTGANPFVHDLLSLAFVPLDRSKEILSVHVSRRGGVNWNNFAKENFKKFRSEWIDSAVDVRSAALQVQQYIASLGMTQVTLAGHNVGFDRAFLQKLAHLSEIDFLSSFSHRTIDTHSLIYERVLKGLLPASCLTSDGAFRFFDAEPKGDDRHTAVGDAIATRVVIERLFGL